MTRLRIPCDFCDGRGAFCLVNSMDPSAKLYDCEQCGGDGNARCGECDEPAVDIYTHTSRGQRFDHPVCAVHLAEWLEDEQEAA